MRWYTVEANANGAIYFRINGTDYATCKCTVLQGNDTTITLGAALCKNKNDNYQFPGSTGATTTAIFVSTAKLANNTITISNANDTFEILTDTQVVALMYMGLYPAKVPTCSVNGMLQKKGMPIIKSDGATQVVSNAVLPRI